MVNLTKDKSIEIDNDIDLSDIKDNKNNIKYIIIGTIIISFVILLIALIIGIILYMTIIGISHINLSIIKTQLKEIARPIIVAIITMTSMFMIYNFAKLLYT